MEDPSRADPANSKVSILESGIKFQPCDETRYIDRCALRKRSLLNASAAPSVISVVKWAKMSRSSAISFAFIFFVYIPIHLQVSKI